jgi:hypothetical protein
MYVHDTSEKTHNVIPSCNDVSTPKTQLDIILITFLGCVTTYVWGDALLSSSAAGNFAIGTA